MLSLYIGAGSVAVSAAVMYLARRGVAYAQTKPALTTETRSVGVSKLARFPYGSNLPFDMALMPHCLGIAAVAVAGAIALTTPSGPITSNELARGPALVTLMWVWGYFNHIKAQIVAKNGCNEQGSKVAERSLYNTLEQGVPFLALLWVTSVCVDAAMATSLGFVYCALRMFYGFAYAYYGGFSMCVEAITMPNYMVLSVYSGALLSFGLGFPSVFDMPVIGQSFLLWMPVLLVGHVFVVFVMWDYPLGKATSMLNLAYNAKDEKPE